MKCFLDVSVRTLSSKSFFPSVVGAFVKKDERPLGKKDELCSTDKSRMMGDSCLLTG